jgi:hypothetical protein
MFFNRLPRILLLSGLLAWPLAGQTPAPVIAPDKQDKETPAATPAQRPDAETEKAAWELLNSVLSDADGFRLPDNRFAVKRIGAALWWGKDPARARDLYRQAAAAWLQGVERFDPEDMAEARLGYQVMRGREQMLSQLAAQDAALALELLRRTRLPPELAAALNYEESAEHRLEAGIISELAVQDAGETLKLAREQLARYGPSPALVDLVKKLKERDAAKASELAGEIASKLRGGDLRGQGELRQAALELWQAALPAANDAAAPEKALLERGDFRALSEQLAAALEKRPGYEGESDEIFNTLQSNLAALEKQAPNVAAKVRREARRRERLTIPAATVSAATDSAPADPSQQIRVEIESATLAESFDLINKAPAHLRSGLYYQLGAKIEQSDPEEARRLLTEKMPNSQYRQQLIAQLDERVVLATAAKGNLEKLRAQLNNIRNPNKRLSATVQAASALASQDRAAALKLLDEVAPLVSQPARTATQLSTQAALLRVYADVEPGKAFAVLETMAGRLDELIPSALAVAEFIGEGEMIENDEFRLWMIAEGGGRFLPGEIEYIVKILARHDFARLKLLAERFQRPEARTLARMIVVLAVLEPTARPSAEQAKPAAATAQQP